MRNPRRPQGARTVARIPDRRRLVTAVVSTALVLFLSIGCASPTPAPAQPVTAVPTTATGAPVVVEPTLAPYPAPTSSSGIALASAGSWSDAAFDYPLQLIVGEDQIVTFEIVPDVQQASIIPYNPPTAVLQVEAASSDAKRMRLPYRLALFPIMSAELGPEESDFARITGSQASRLQPIDTTSKTIWSWTVHPKKAGSARITLRVNGQVTIGGVKYDRGIINDTRTVPVRDRPLLERIADGVTTNLPLLFGASGPLALILAWLTFRAGQQKKKAGEHGEHTSP